MVSVLKWFSFGQITGSIVLIIFGYYLKVLNLLNPRHICPKKTAFSKIDVIFNFWCIWIWVFIKSLANFEKAHS